MNQASGKQSEVAPAPTTPRFGRLDLGLEKVSAGIARSVEWLLSLQHEEGYWCGELEADSMLESDYILLYIF